jgi:splicing factor 3A subunit 1
MDGCVYREVEEGRAPLVVENIAKPPPPPEASKASTVIAATKESFVSPIARLTSNKPEEPQLLEFSIVHPNGISALDFDIMRLTAQYTAANGRDFLAGIAQREQRNPQFDFLKPTHMLFNYFTSLVDSYSKILLPSAELKSRIHENTSPATVLKHAVNRWDWNRIDNEKKRNNEQAQDEERQAFQSIDWFDFTVVETIDFPEDELLDANSNASKPALSNTTAPAFNHATNMPPPPPPRPVAVAMDQDMDMDMDDGDLKVVSNYVPRTAQHTSSTLMMADPISGKSIPADKVEDHMRVQLIDPSYKIQQKRFQDKQLETGYAEGSSIADSLKLFAKKRSDIFGNEDRKDEDASMEEESPSIQWDGHQSSIAMTMQMKSDLKSKLPDSQSAAATGIENNVGPRPPSSYAAPMPPPPPMHMAPLPNSYTVTPIPPPMPMPVAPASPAPWFGYGNQGMPPSFPPPPPISFPLPPSNYPIAIPPASTEVAKESMESQEPAMIPEDDFAARYTSSITVSIITPVDNSASTMAWRLQGQSVMLTVDIRSSCKDLKELLSAQLGGMPANKQQLKLRSGGWFLKDASSLAAMNVGDGAVLELSVRSRGGKK